MIRCFVVIILLALPLYAQSTAEVTGTTSAGDPIATYRGQKYIMLKADQVRQINDKLDRLTQLEAALPVCQQLNIDYAKRVDTAKQEANGWQTLYTGEHQLRLDMQQFQKRPSRVSSFLDRWYIKLPITFAPTIVSAMK